MGNTISTMLSSFTRISDVIRGIFPGENTREENSFGPPDFLLAKRETKSIETWQYYFNLGNQYLTSNNPKVAVQRYTDCLRFAPANSNTSNDAYIARSDALFRLNLIADSLADISHVCLDRYPNELKAQLFYRKARCYQILEPNREDKINNAFEQFYTWLPHMEKKNQVKMIKKMNKDRQIAVLIDSEDLNEQIDAEMIAPTWDPEYSTVLPFISDDIDLKYERIHGKYLVTKKNFTESEIIAIQIHKPYVTIIELDKRLQLCWNCGKQQWSSVPCLNCTWVIFCSVNCRETAWAEYHDYECQTLHQMRKLKTENRLDDFCMYATLKLTIRAIKESHFSYAELSETMENINNSDTDFAVPHEESYSRLYASSSKIDNSEDGKKYLKLFENMALILVSANLYGTADAVISNDILKDENSVVQFLMGVLKENFIIAKNNGILFGKISKKLYMIVPAIEPSTESCKNIDKQPNENNKIGIVSIRDIPAGQEIQLSKDCIAKFYGVPQKTCNEKKF